MAPSRRPLRLHAFSADDSRFGPARRLDLRQVLATDGADASHHAERWLRERQAAKAGDVLVLVGRGSSPVTSAPDEARRTIEALLRTLRRAGVIEHVRPVHESGFVVRLAPLRALFNAPARSRGRWSPGDARRSVLPDVLPDVLPEDARADLRRIAELSLLEVGVRVTPALVDAEMRRILTRLSPAVAADESDRGDRYRFLLSAVRREYENT